MRRGTKRKYTTAKTGVILYFLFMGQQANIIVVITGKKKTLENIEKLNKI